jgi:alkaline phosphatase D
MRIVLSIALIVTFLNSFSQKLLCPPLYSTDSASNLFLSFLIRTSKDINIEVLGKDTFSFTHTNNSVYRRVNNFTVSVPKAFNKDSCTLEISVKNHLLYQKHYYLPTRTSSDDISLLFGSCAFIGTGIYKAVKLRNPLDIFSTMNKDTNDGMIWLGDNVYYLLETRKEKLMVRRMTKIRKKKDKLSDFISSTPQYAIWDDHDFGPNNSDGSFENKFASERVFKSFWPNPYDSTLREGNYCYVSKGDVDIFLMDDRFFSKKWESMLGETQLQWLLAKLKSSTASFKLICIGNQVINPNTSGETYSKFITEYHKLLEYIKNMKIEGVLFVSGDRHHGNLQMLSQPDMYPLYNFTTSPLTSWLNPQNTSKWENANPKVISGTQVNDYNYGKIIVTGTQDNRILTIQSKSASGKIYWEYRIAETELKFQP